MGYHVTILRSAQGKQQPISLHEASAAAAALGRWRFVEAQASFVLDAKSDQFTLYYQDGELWASSPNREQLGAMLELARQLCARVRGDEFETYSSPNTTFHHPDDVTLGRAALAKSRALIWRDPLSPEWVRIYIIAFFALLGLVGYVVGKWFERQ